MFVILISDGPFPCLVFGSCLVFGLSEWNENERRILKKYELFCMIRFGYKISMTRNRAFLHKEED